GWGSVLPPPQCETMRAAPRGKIQSAATCGRFPAVQNRGPQQYDGGATSSLPRLRGRDREGARNKTHACKLTPSPTLPRQRGREQTELAARADFHIESSLEHLSPRAAPPTFPSARP